MDPNKWGSYGWKMIHSVSRVPGIPMEMYRKWLRSTAAILPCRKCRRNFRRHIRSGRCDYARSPAFLGICLHAEVSKDIGKKTAASAKRYTEEDLPEPTIQNIFQPTFWLTVANNKTLRKTGPLREWFRDTEEILNAASGDMYDDAAQALRDLQMGAFGPVLKHSTESVRQRHLVDAVRKMLIAAGVTELPTQGSISRMRSTTARSRRVSRASTKRRHTDARSSRLVTRRRSRAASSRTSSV